jgi:pyruvate,orthophosphate dikinase
MDKRIHFFSQKAGISPLLPPELLGIRGRQANEFAELGFPILPGFILDAAIASELGSVDIKKDLKTLLARCSEIVQKNYGDPENPMLLKIVVSSNLAVSNYPVLHNFGLVKPVAAGFARWVGDAFAAHEVLFLVRGMLRIEERIRELAGRVREREKIARQLEALDRRIRGEDRAQRAET